MYTRTLSNLLGASLLAVALLFLGIMLFVSEVALSDPITWINYGSFCFLSSIILAYFASKQYLLLHGVLADMPNLGSE